MKIIKVPEFSGKISLEQLNDIPKISCDINKLKQNEPAFFSAKESGFIFDFLWHPKKDSNKLFVFFSGDAARQKYNPPVFQRWSWAKLLPGHCLFISDPSLYLNNHLGLAWYAGTENFDPLPYIASVTSAIANRFYVPTEKIFSYGSSGGGFAAIRLGAFLPGINAIAINPQTVVTKYRLKKVEKYLQVCFSNRNRTEALQQFPDRLSILNEAKNNNLNKIIYAQNTLDEHHFEEHFKPFVASYENLDIKSIAKRLSTILFSHEGGHLKAETSEVFTKIMNLVEL